MEVKKNMLWAFAFIGMVIAGSALTVYVSTEQEARDTLRAGVSLQAGACGVVNEGIIKSVESEAQISENQYIVNFALEYTINGETQREGGMIQTNNIDLKNLETVVEKECDSLWTMIQAQEKVTVVIKPENDIFNRIYNVLTKQWSNK